MPEKLRSRLAKPSFYSVKLRLQKAIEMKKMLFGAVAMTITLGGALSLHGATLKQGATEGTQITGAHAWALRGSLPLDWRLND